MAHDYDSAINYLCGMALQLFTAFVGEFRAPDKAPSYDKGVLGGIMISLGYLDAAKNPDGIGDSASNLMDRGMDLFADWAASQGFPAPGSFLAQEVVNQLMNPN